MCCSNILYFCPWISRNPFIPAGCKVLKKISKKFCQDISPQEKFCIPDIRLKARKIPLRKISGTTEGVAKPGGPQKCTGDEKFPGIAGTGMKKKTESAKNPEKIPRAVETHTLAYFYSLLLVGQKMF